MSLYSHVPGRAELVDLMVDQVHTEATGGRAGARADRRAPDRWREALTEVAEQNRALHERHPWLADIDTTRPPLGPGTIAKYDHELGALDGTGLTDVEMDQALSLVLDHVRASQRQIRTAAMGASDEHTTTDGDWWDRAGRVLATVLDDDDFPLATRIGSAAGEEYGAPTDPRRGYHFGLAVILDGIETLIRDRG